MEQTLNQISKPYTLINPHQVKPALCTTNLIMALQMKKNHVKYWVLLK